MNIKATPIAGTGESPCEKNDALTRATLKVTWRLLPFLFICYFFAYLDRVNVGFAKLQMLSDLKMSDAVYGLGAGVFFLGYFLFEVPSNLILHKVGARKWIARIMISWGLISASFSSSTHPQHSMYCVFCWGLQKLDFPRHLAVFDALVSGLDAWKDHRDVHGSDSDFWSHRCAAFGVDS